MKYYVIGIDIGTAGTKTGIFDNNGTLVAYAYEESKLRYPRPGWVEQDMNDFYLSAVRTLRRAVEESGIDRNRIVALGVTGQMSGIGMIDENWNPVAHYDSWLDTRCEPYIRLMQERARLKVLQKTGCPPTYAHCAKMLWWKTEHPEIFSRVAKFIVAGCFVAGKLAGLTSSQAFIDWTYLHYTGLADIKKLEWDDELCEIFSIPKEKLPRIIKPTEIVGRLSPQAARQCGLPSGLPIVSGAGDTTASYLGAGVVRPGVLFDVAGTASVLASCVESYSPDVHYGTVMCTRSAIDGLWHPIAFINGGGLCLRWFRDEVADCRSSPKETFGRDVYQILDEWAALVPPGSDGLLFIPHLGGRVLPPQPELRGSWVGFSWGQTKAHFYRSILEGIAYEYYFYYKIMQELYPEIRFSEVRVIGGGAKSALWNQIKADVLGIPYVRVAQPEPAILGSALIAGTAVGLFPDLAQTAQSFVTIRDKVEPRPAYHAFYREYAEAYIRLLSDLASTYRVLSKLREMPSPGGLEGDVLTRLPQTNRQEHGGA
ncbi:MAG: FGGY family carbohydrate kinase [Thermosphaera sp.]